MTPHDPADSTTTAANLKVKKPCSPERLRANSRLSSGPKTP
jgi:hypothetical protein